MRPNLLGVLIVTLVSVAGCTSDEGRSPIGQPVPEANTEERSIQVPDVIGVDLVKAIARLEEARLAVDVSALPKSFRGYATGLQTHPRVQVTHMDPPPGANVREGTTIAILHAKCPARKSRNVC